MRKFYDTRLGSKEFDNKQSFCRKYLASQKRNCIESFGQILKTYRTSMVERKNQRVGAGTPFSRKSAKASRCRCHRRGDMRSLPVHALCKIDSQNPSDIYFARPSIRALEYRWLPAVRNWITQKMADVTTVCPNTILLLRRISSRSICFLVRGD